MTRHSIRLMACWGPLGLLIPAIARAQGVDAPGELDQMVRTMERISQGMTSGIVDVAVTLLYTMAAIEFAWTFGKGTLQGEAMAALLAKLIVRLVVVGVFLVCLQYGADLVQIAIDSALAVAGVGGVTTEPSPSQVLAQALDMVGQILGELSVLSPGYSIGLVLVGLAVVITAAAMAAMIILVYAELYLMAVAGLLGLGFGGLEATRDIAINYIRMLVGKAFKLLTLLIVNGMVMATLETAFQLANPDLFTALQLLIVQVVGLVLLLQLPSAVEGLFGGGANAAASIAGSFGAAMTGRALMTAGMTAGGAAYGGVRGGIIAGRRAASEDPLVSAMNASTSGVGKAIQKAAPVLKGGAAGAAGGAVSGLSGDGPHRQAARDVLKYLNRDRK